uniref:Uncharacterized protein n=1 Tax=Anguilla anguilla TaxID=7936 RepID=A0A0E9WNX6_ANGAN
MHNKDIWQTTSQVRCYLTNRKKLRESVVPVHCNQAKPKTFFLYAPVSNVRVISLLSYTSPQLPCPVTLC